MESILELLPNVIFNIVVEYDQAVCSDCKNMSRDYVKCNTCDVIRCQYHNFMNANSITCRSCSKHYIWARNTIMCIRHPDIIASYGYKDIICYCTTCAHDKKVIKYEKCCICGYPAINYEYKTSKMYCDEHKQKKITYVYYVDLRINIPEKELIQICCNCNKRCRVIYTCKCLRQRCLHCFVQSSWIDNGYLKCNYCNYVNLYSVEYIKVYCPCSICSDQTTNIDVINNMYYCLKHLPLSETYYISFTKICKNCYAYAFDELGVCISHLMSLCGLIYYINIIETVLSTST